jgi:hypothetical protein
MGNSSFFDDFLSTSMLCVDHFFWRQDKGEESMKHVFVLSLVLFLSGCMLQPTNTQTCIVAQVVYEAESIDASFELCGPTTLVADILNNHVDELQLELTSSSFGDYVSGLLGVNFETLGVKYYWAILVNDEMAAVGISELIVESGDRLLFVASPY